MSSKASCKESAQTQTHTPEKPTLVETHIDVAHSDVSFPHPIDEPQVTSVTQPPIMSAILSSTCPTLLISFITSRVGDSSIPSDVDLPFSTLEEPLSSGPQEPITQSIMDTTPPNTEIDQGRFQSDIETTTTLVDLPPATYPEEVVVTVSVTVNDFAGTTAFIAIEDKPDVSVSLAVTSSPAVVVPTVVFTQTDSIVSTKVAVTSTQHLHEDVILEDDSDDEDVPISSLFNVHSLPSSLLDSSTAHTHATRLSEGAKKKRETNEQSLGNKNEGQPNVLAK